MNLIKYISQEDVKHASPPVFEIFPQWLLYGLTHAVTTIEEKNNIEHAQHTTVGKLSMKTISADRKYFLKI